MYTAVNQWAFKSRVLQAWSWYTYHVPHARRLMVLLSMWIHFCLCADGFCTIKDCRLVLPSEKSVDSGVFQIVEVGGYTIRESIPYLRVLVQTAVTTLGVRVNAMAHYFSEDKGPIESVGPFPRVRESGESLALPTYFEAGRPVVLCFPVPKRVDAYAVWSAIVVIGDTNDVAVATFPCGTVRWNDYAFPEKNIALNGRRVERKADVNPLVEYTFGTRIKSHPRITFFLRKPTGMHSFVQSRGVLALCLLSHDVEGVKRRLQEAEARDDLTDVLRFAEDRGLTILCWGSQRFWDPRMNWDELARREAKSAAVLSREMADAWETAVKRIVTRYKIPERNYLLSGFSGAAQYALRLAMEKPQYFLAVHVHVPSSFPHPTPKAADLLLCLTTGEWESGYDRSIRFLEEAQTVGIPIVYKAIPRLGHATHPLATRLGLACFDFALENPNKRSWRPVYSGDVYRQSVSPYVENPIAPGILIHIPSRSIAEAWL